MHSRGPGGWKFPTGTGITGIAGRQGLLGPTGLGGNVEVQVHQRNEVALDVQG